MILLRSKMILAWFILLACCTILSAAELDPPSIPLPADAVKVMEKATNIGPSQSITVSYETALSLKKLNALYKKEMVKEGWMEQANNCYLKDNYTAVILFTPPRKSNGKTRLSIATFRIPGKEEVLATRKTTPDKVDFMPIYPGSVQNFFWDLPAGVSGSYETESSIKDVVFFYKSGMLNYGWQLYSETPITTKDIDCPGCKKSASGAGNKAQPDTVNTASKTSLVFRRGYGETCIIRLYSFLMDNRSLAEATPLADDMDINLPKKTTILVSYNAKKKINP